MVWMWTEVDRKMEKSTSQNYSKKIELKAMANQTFRKEPEAQVMCFMRNYAERYDWFEQTFQDYQIHRRSQYTAVLMICMIATNLRAARG